MARRNEHKTPTQGRIYVTFSRREYDTIARHADEAGVSMSAFVRAVFRHGLTDLYEGRAHLERTTD